MTSLPGRELFDRQRFDPSALPAAMTDLALRMAKSIEAEDLKELSRLSRLEPSALFFKIPELAGREDDERAPISALRLKEPSFAFDAGLAWAVAAGERFDSLVCAEAFKGYLTASLSAWSDARRPAIAFASGALQAPMAPAALSAWLTDYGVEALAGIPEFGSVEIAIWGEGLTQRARDRETLPGWCAHVIAQAIRLRLDGSPAESQELIAFAERLGAPKDGWMSTALKRIEPLLDERLDELSSRLKQWGGHQDSGEKALIAYRQWMERWEDIAAQVCAEGPPSWSEKPLGTEYGREATAALAAKVEKAILARQTTPETPRSNDHRPGSLRV